MPYITKWQREELDSGVAKPRTPGELNYVLTRIILDYITQEKYSEYNEVMGVLSCVQQELYRRLIAPYEENKAKENGDVY